MFSLKAMAAANAREFSVLLSTQPRLQNTMQDRVGAYLVTDDPPSFLIAVAKYSLGALVDSLSDWRSAPTFT